MDSPEMYEMFEGFKAILVKCGWSQNAIVIVWQSYRISKTLEVDFYYAKKKI